MLVLRDLPMPCFRTQLAQSDSSPIDEERVAQACARAMCPENFFIASPQRLVFEHHAHEEVFWEIFQGRLLDGSQTRERRSFESWNVYLLGEGGSRSLEPIFSVRWDQTGRRLFVTRAILCHVHESYVSAGNVVLTREAQKWQRELVGAIDLALLRTVGELHDELACQLFLAVVGKSRLPLTSIESPLPGFTLGQIGYWHRANAAADHAKPNTSDEQLGTLAARESLSEFERVKLLEFRLRRGEIETLEPDPVRIREVFNAVSLSPFTNFTSNALSWIQCMVERGSITMDQHADLLASLLLQISSHLAAYDLVTFHHRGANYPDALLLDELLSDLLRKATEHPDLIRGNQRQARLRRRAILHGAVLRTEYAHQLVPDLPTSTGENCRVLPAPFGRVPEEQIVSIKSRTRRLFDDEWHFDRTLIGSCLRDLVREDELLSLGTAIYLDRPLGFAKLPGEPDATLLCSHVLFSRTIAQHRLQILKRRADWNPHDGDIDGLIELLRQLPVDGTPLDCLGPPPRPGVVSLHDTGRIAGDFVLLRTTQRTIRAFARQFDIESLEQLGLPASEWRLVVPGGSDAAPTLRVYDATLRLRAELSVDLSCGYSQRAGMEFPAAGLRVLQWWDQAGKVSQPGLCLRPL